MVAYLVSEPLSEWFSHREDDTSVLRLDGITLQIVKLTVRIRLVVVVQSVEVHHLQQRRLLELLLGQIVEVDASSVTQILDVHLEVLLLYRHGSELVDILHHQSPVGYLWRAACVLQELDIESLVAVLLVGRELTYLICLSVVRILIRHGQSLISLHGCLQAYISEVFVERIVRRGEQTSVLHLLVFHTALHDGIEHSCCLVNVASFGIGSGHAGVEVIACVARVCHTC